MRFLLCCAIGVSFTACATYEPPVDSGVANTEVINKSYDSTWQKATEWFANNNIPIKNIVKDSGLIATDYRLGADSSFIDCGKVGTYEAFGDKNINVNLIAKKANASTTNVRLNVFGTGTVNQADLYGNSTGRGRTIDCLSTGKLETELFEYLRQ